MANLVNWIEEELNNEIIEAVVIGTMGWDDYGSEEVPQYAEQPKGKIISWAEAKPLLDYEFDCGYGSPECNAIYVWTPTRVFFISTYDGSTSLCFIPRNPTTCEPSMTGGG